MAKAKPLSKPARNKLIALGAALVVAGVGCGAKAVLHDAPATTRPPPSTGPCALPKYPDASCTGVPAGTQLTVVDGNMSVNTANTVIEGKDIHGCVDVSAPGVIIRKSKISCSSFGVVTTGGYTGTPLLLEDVEVTCNLTAGTGVGDNNFTIRRGSEVIRKLSTTSLPDFGAPV